MENDLDDVFEFASFIADEVNNLYKMADELELDYIKDNWDNEN